MSETYTRRTVLVGAAALSLASAGATGDDAPLFAVLDATGPLLAEQFHPGKAIASMRALLALAPAARVAALRRYLAVRKDPPEGLFAVLRGLVEIPPLQAKAEPWPGVLQQGYLRPPALGGPLPRQPDDLAQVPCWPLVMLEDVPLVEVQGYILGGQPEPLSMHLDGLAHATWRTRPLAPTQAGSVRYLLIHWGRWAESKETSALFEAQLQRLEQG